jgi:GTP pyrophosphokinase
MRVTRYIDQPLPERPAVADRPGTGADLVASGDTSAVVDTAVVNDPVVDRPGVREPVSSDSAQADDQAPSGARNSAPVPTSASRRVRARLARRITAGRSAAVKPVLEPLVSLHRELYPKADLTLLQRAYDVADELHSTQMRKSGDPYITHPLAVANILAELGMDTTTLVAALQHDTLDDTGYSKST